MLAGNIFGNTNFGQFVEVNLTTDVQTVIGTGGREATSSLLTRATGRC